MDAAHRAGSGKCHDRTHAAPQRFSRFNHFIGEGEDEVVDVPAFPRKKMVPPGHPLAA
jgi:hypothetical protein